ncbi:lysosome-associated membrane glycoprotein 5 [Elysia marginata]|uniref:Lysosome-associated membrane glycoprotein 5 n=1 Tax=Elysia marginata TaxID=1093978 RepID=A0AAV4FKZ2_9GAST|nr:lysosome-associated membrane glycoprotein 5 [Elysia marginata]
MNHKNLVVLVLSVFFMALADAAHSNTTNVEESPFSVNSTVEDIFNVSIAHTEIDANYSHILVVSSKSGQPCLLAALNATIQISYEVLEVIVHESYETTEDIQLPEDVSAHGVCGGNQSHLLLEWGNGTFHLNLTFSIKESDLVSENRTWSMTAISVSYDLDNLKVFPAASEASVMSYEKSGLTLFTTELGRTYACDRDVTVQVGPEDKGVTVNFHNVKLAAFGVTSSEFPSVTDDCAAEGDSNDSEDVLVPLIVACCLSAIVIIIVIGYVINRTIQRRREQSDYRAM